MINLSIHPLILTALLIIIKIICLLVAIAYYTIAERKIMAAIQRRRGPNVVGFWGLLQPLADGLKLVAKEMVIPTHANGRIFLIAPMLILTLSLMSWGIIPFGLLDLSETVTFKTSGIELLNFEMHKISIITENSNFHLIIETSDIINAKYGILIILAFSSLSVYGLIIAGWASNSKYAFLGALRSAAQMISYEVSISLVLLPVILLAGSLNFVEIVYMQNITTWFVLPLLPVSLIFIISMVAETNRTPFDLPEAEAELVAGYNVEYSSIIFAMFFLAEYGNMILMSLLKSLLFLGGWYFLGFSSAIFLVIKTLFFCFLFVLIRATFPRYRYDQLMNIGWKMFLPLATGYLLLCVGILVGFDAVPTTNELYTINYIETTF